MKRRRPVLNQADADEHGFRLFARNHRTWIRLGSFLSVVFAVDAILMWESVGWARLLILLAFGAAIATLWMARFRYEISFAAAERRVAVVDVFGFRAAKTGSFSADDLEYVEFGACDAGRQSVCFVWKDDRMDPVRAVLFGAGRSEGEMARLIRRLLAKMDVRVRG